MTFKRDKDKIEIEGEAKDIKLLVAIDLLSRWLRLVPFILLALKWLKCG